MVDKDNYLLELSRYLHLNPVRAGMAQKPEDCPYSSYRSYTGGRPECIVSPDSVLRMLTARMREAPGRYRNFVESVMGEEMANPLRKVYGGVILGSKRFIKDALDRVKYERIQSPAVSHSKALLLTLGIEEIISACCEHFGAAREEITYSRRSQSRKTCIYLIKKHTSAKNREIAESFGTLTYSAVAKINGSMMKQLAADKELREEIKRLEANFSFFKLFCFTETGQYTLQQSLLTRFEFILSS